jgi:hypothetical protein
MARDRLERLLTRRNVQMRRCNAEQGVEINGILYCQGEKSLYYRTVLAIPFTKWLKSRAVNGDIRIELALRSQIEGDLSRKWSSLNYLRGLWEVHEILTVIYENMHVRSRRNWKATKWINSIRSDQKRRVSAAMSRSQGFLQDLFSSVVGSSRFSN